MTPEQAGAVLTVDLGAIARNWQSLQARLKDGVQCAAVLKTDAYGLGADKVGPALAKAGCRIFFVAYSFEGAALRRILPDADIYVLHGVLPGTEQDFVQYNLIPVISSLRQAEAFNLFAAGEHKRLPAALHIDTGMTRLALTEKNVAAYCVAVPENIDVRLVISHLACADEVENPKNEDQLKRFDALCAMLRKALPHDFKESLSATDGTLIQDSRYHKDIVRPGIALYDGAVTLEAKILEVQDTEPGRTVGYGATYELKEKSRIVTLAIGYGDGYPRLLSGKGQVYLLGRHMPVVGRVSMDLITVEASGADWRELRAAQTAEIIGPHCPLKEIAKQAGTIDYEILTGLGRRFFREYKNQGQDP